MLLASLDRSGDVKRFADIGFSAYLTKPVRTLASCSIVLNRALVARGTEDWGMRSQPIITRGTLVANEVKTPILGSRAAGRGQRHQPTRRATLPWNGSAAKCTSSVTASRPSTPSERNKLRPFLSAGHADARAMDSLGSYTQRIHQSRKIEEHTTPSWRSPQAR